MERAYTTDTRFDKADFSQSALPMGDYENCTFTHCNFADTDLRDIHFTDCTFTGCNLSNAGLQNAAFREVVFKDCKMLGLHFDHCNEFLFAVTFENCQLNLSVFYKRKMKKTRFIACNLRETDFSEADLSQAVFKDCDLAAATFDQTNLEGADLRTAYNYNIDPDNNRIKKAKFSLSGITGLLDKYGIEISL